MERGRALMSGIKVFLSTVSDEFRLYRDQLDTDLDRQNVEVKVQEDFKDLASHRGHDRLSAVQTGSKRVARQIS
jgi:hypothetical protein